MTKEEQAYHSAASAISDSVESQMFGKPCYKLGKKAYCSFFQNEMVFKLTQDAHHEAINLEGAKLFDPSGKGRAMKEWVQIPFDYQADWGRFAEAAADYVGG